MKYSHGYLRAIAPHVVRSHKLSMPLRRAFSLPDLLAVGLMGALLLPLVPLATHGTAQRSRQAVCLDRLRAIGTATAAYSAADLQGAALPVHPLFHEQDPTNPTFIGAYEWGGKSGIGRDGFLTGTPGDPLNSKYGTKAGFGPATRPLNDFLYPHGFRDHLTPAVDPEGARLDTQLQLSAFRCPADSSPPLGAHCPDWVAHPQRSSFDQFGTSYAANVYFVTFPDRSIASNSPFLRPMSRVPNPARTINYEENIGRWAWSAIRLTDECLWLGDGIDPGPTKVIPGWHGKDWTFNHGYVDGHADRRTLYVPGTEDVEGFVNHYVIERVFEDDAQQQVNRCVIVRGDGWQKDTLPDPFIDTGLFSPGGRGAFEGCVQTD